MSERVLVALDRKVAETTVEMGLIAKGHSEICRCSPCSIRDALRAALDTDREELEALVIRAMMNVGKVKPTFGDYAGAVLAVLEGDTE